MSKPPVQHIAAIDASKEWSQGWIGLLSRYRSIGGLIGSQITVSGVMAYFKANPALLSIPVSVGVFGAAMLLVVRHSRIHRHKTDNELHDLCHNIRDVAARVLGHGPTGGEARSLFLAFNQRIAQDVADFFRELTGDKSVTCAIRLACKNDKGGNEYRTVGRSSGMDAVREHQTVPISAEVGLPNKLRSTKYHGVCLIDNIAEAIASKDYFETPNDSLPDCRSMMVCPINGWESGTKNMTGIITVASPRLAAFRGWHTTSCKAIADMLGLVYPSLLGKIDDEVAKAKAKEAARRLAAERRKSAKSQARGGP